MRIAGLNAGLAAVLFLSAASGVFGSMAGQKVLDVLEGSAIQTVRPSGSALIAVATAGKRLVAVGEHGRIILSDDDGATWRQAKTVPIRATLTAVRFATPRKGWAVGHSGVVLRSEDGGETWNMQLDGRKAAQLVFDSVQGGAGAGRGGRASPGDRLALAKRLVEDGADKPFLDIYAESEDKAFVVGAYNLIFRTEDGGKSWQPWLSHVDNPEELHFYAMQRSGRDCYLVGEQGLLLRSSDGLKTFKPLKSPYVGTFFGMIAARGGDLVLYGLRGNAYWSGDRGASWRKIDIGKERSFMAGAELADGSLLLLTADGDVLQSRDRGRTFQPSHELKSHVSGVAQASGGGIVTVGLRGVARIDAASAKTGETGAAK